MDVETADGEAGSVWSGYGDANYNPAFCAFRGHKLYGKSLCAWHAEKSQPFNRKQFSVASQPHIHLTI